MGSITLIRGRNAWETFKFAFRDGEDRKVTDDEVDEALTWLDEKEGRKGPIHILVATGGMKVRWNKESGELEFVRR